MKRVEVSLPNASSTTILPAVASASALAEDGQTFTTGVQNLSVLRFPSFFAKCSSVGLDSFHAIIEPLIGCHRSNAALQLVGGFAECRNRIDERTVAFTPYDGLKFQKGDEITFETVFVTHGSKRMSGREVASVEGIGKLLPVAADGTINSVCPPPDKVASINLPASIVINKAPDPMLDGGTLRADLATDSKRVVLEVKTRTDFTSKSAAIEPFKVKSYSANQCLLLQAKNEYWGSKLAANYICWIEETEFASGGNRFITDEFEFIARILFDRATTFAASLMRESVLGLIDNMRTIVFGELQARLADGRVWRALVHGRRHLIGETVLGRYTIVSPDLQIPLSSHYQIKHRQTSTCDFALMNTALLKAGHKAGPTPRARALDQLICEPVLCESSDRREQPGEHYQLQQRTLEELAPESSRKRQLLALPTLCAASPRRVKQREAQKSQRSVHVQQGRLQTSSLVQTRARDRRARYPALHRVLSVRHFIMEPQNYIPELLSKAIVRLETAEPPIRRMSSISTEAEI